MTRVETIAEALRQEPYCLFSFRRNCIGKSLRFKKLCRQIGVVARAVVCIGLTQAKPIGFWMQILTIHAWGEVGGKRVEVAMPLGKVGMWGIVDVDIKPILGIWV